MWNFNFDIIHVKRKYRLTVTHDRKTNPLRILNDMIGVK